MPNANPENHRLCMAGGAGSSTVLKHPESKRGVTENDEGNCIQECRVRLTWGISNFVRHDGHGLQAAASEFTAKADSKLAYLQQI